MKKVGILGFGVVGSGVAEVVEMNREKIAVHMGEPIVVKRILDVKDFPGNRFNELITHDADEFFGDDEISIVVETIGGVGIAYQFTKRALSAGKSVVTSNKELVSTHGVELMEIAEKNFCCYLFEAAVGGGIPIIRPLHRCLAANQILKIAGIVNGTTNYILTSMRDAGISYEEALAQAQAKGYAERNPTADVEGIDAQRKLSILSTIALDGRYIPPDTIHTEGISAITLKDIEAAEKIGCSVKLLAVFTHPLGGKPSAFVAPFIVCRKAIIASVDGVFNAILVEGNALGESLFYGQGAGKLATASAVVGDVLDAGLHFRKNAHITKWYCSDEKDEIIGYEEISTDIAVFSGCGQSGQIIKAFGGYDIEVLCDDEDTIVVVRNVLHKDADRLTAGINGAKWMHYYR